jgi:hypothetical protein
MKYVIIFFVSMFLVIAVVNIVQTGDKPGISKDKTATDTKTSRIYPIAPGVWYPGDGALPEKPIRYYRARCWPGCHSGSPQGKYPNRPLNMKPIFPTSTVPAQPTKLRDTK